MTEIKSMVPKHVFSACNSRFFDEKTFLLDIETTGLSSGRNFIYCIGCACSVGEDAGIRLLFAENRSQEPEILRQFCEIIRPFSRIVTFNGTTFDIPFLNRRLEKYGIPDPFTGKEFLDLYREAVRLKSLLRLENYRQKSIEQFLGIGREDIYSGGELISVYLNYEKHADPAGRDLLLMHNRDDVLGMFGLLSLLSYRSFVDGDFKISRLVTEQDGERPFLNMILTPDTPFPESIRLFHEDVKILLDRDRALLRLPVSHGILRHYFEDYKNYYYLPAEDTVVHKSVGSYVESGHRQKATRDTCYIKKECRFLHLPVPAFDGYLRQSYTDRDAYLDLSALPEEYDGPPPDQIISDELYRFLLLLLQNIRLIT